jgi:ADP-ribose pyrophosphatase YjhB (NUDIX family)
MGQEYPVHPVPAVAGVVIRDDDDGHRAVLLVRRANPPSQGEWSLPGGVLELGETLEAGVAREVLEETGVVVEPVVVIEVLDHIVHDEEGRHEQDSRVRFHYVLIDFLCRPVNGTAIGGSDALEARWVMQQHLGEYGLQSRTLRVIHKGFAASA